MKIHACEIMGNFTACGLIFIGKCYKNETIVVKNIKTGNIIKVSTTWHKYFNNTVTCKKCIKSIP